MPRILWECVTCGLRLDFVHSRVAVDEHCRLHAGSSYWNWCLSSVLAVCRVTDTTFSPN